MKASNGGPGNGRFGNGRLGNGEGNGQGAEPVAGPQPALIQHEPLYKRFCKIKLAVFEGSSNPVDVEE